MGRSRHNPAKQGREKMRPPAPERETVLIVDDDRDTVDILQRYLAREFPPGPAGVQILTAFGGRECLEVVQHQHVDVIVLDVMMPGIDGLEVCAALRKDEAARTIPVILLTARDDMETRAAGKNLGVSEFLAKPINKKDLIARVRTQLETRRLQRQLDETIRHLPRQADRK